MIVSAVQKGAIVFVYGAGNRILMQMHGILMGYTANSVSIKKGTIVWDYDDLNVILKIVI